MALLTVAERTRRLKYLGYGEYNKANTKKFQKDAFPNDPKQWDSKWGVNTDRACRHFYNVKKCTKNFKPEEFRCTCGHCTGYPTYMKQVELKHIQKIRDHYKKPMTITSGVRCSYENNRVGGVRNSGHLRGYAVDFYMKGVTDTVEHRKSALSYMKKLDNHEFTYGAYMKDSNGMYRAASGMGNAMHTETHAPIPTLEDKIIEACKWQAQNMKNFKYRWRKYPTKENTQEEGTCVSFGGVVYQILGYLKRGRYLWHDTNGKVTHATKKMKIIYPRKTTIKGYRSKLKKGDGMMVGNPHDVGSGSHICFFAGKWSKNGNPYVYDQNSAKKVKEAERKGKTTSGVHTIDGDRNLFAIIRLMK